MIKALSEYIKEYALFFRPHGTPLNPFGCKMLHTFNLNIYSIPFALVSCVVFFCNSVNAGSQGRILCPVIYYTYNTSMHGRTVHIYQYTMNLRIYIKSLSSPHLIHLTISPEHALIDTQGSDID